MLDYAVVVQDPLDDGIDQPTAGKVNPEALAGCMLVLKLQQRECYVEKRKRALEIKTGVLKQCFGDCKQGVGKDGNPELGISGAL